MTLAQQHITALKDLCGERSITLDRDLPLSDGFGDEAVDVLIGILLAEDVEDPRLDAATLYITTRLLQKKYRRLTPMQKAVRETKEMLDRQPLRPEKIFLDQQSFDDILAWQASS